MSLSGIFEIVFLLLAVFVMAVGSAHTRAYCRSNPTFASHADLDRYQVYVTFQMWGALLFIVPMILAVLCGIYFTWSTEGWIAYLPIIGYWFPTLVGRSAKPMEQKLRGAVLPAGELKDRHELISFVWKKKMLPRF